MSYNFNTIQTDKNYEQYLQYIADLNMSPKAKLELLWIVNSILSHFVDTAFNVQTDQITLNSIGGLTDPLLSAAAIGSDPDNPTEEDSRAPEVSKP